MRSSASAAGKDGESVTSSGGAVRGADGRSGRSVTVTTTGSGTVVGAPGQPGAQDADAAPETRTEVIAGSIGKIVMSTEAGTIKVIGSDDAEVSVTRRIYRTPTEPRETVTRDGDVLRIESGCPVQTGPLPCRIDYELQVPRSVAVELTTASGNVDIGALAGAQTAISASGDVDVTGARGPVVARSVSGRLRFADHAAPTTMIASTSGDVQVQAVSRPELIEVNSTSGSIAITVPDGSYHLEANTMTGRKEVTVPTDPGSDSLIRTRTITGNVRVTGA